MKRFFVIAAVVVAVCIYSNCTTYEFNYYQGYIYTTDGEPIPNLVIHSGIITDSIGITDRNGYFRFENSSSRITDLEVEFEGKVIAYIPVRNSLYRYHIRFVNGRNDTLFIDITGEKENIATINSKLEKLADFQQHPRTPSDIDSVYIDMVYLRGGTFTIGCTVEQGNDCSEDEKPAHSVTVSSFHLSRYEVTQGLWMKVMEYNPSFFKGDSLPVEMVTYNGWNAVQTFIERLNEKTGKKYRLPTEAEWEYAARGGNKSKGYKYSGSIDINEVAWYGDSEREKTHPVGTKQPNELGIYDMSGSVYEWVSDWYGNYRSSEHVNPAGPPSGSTRVFRGGLGARVSARYHGNPLGRSSRIGFRLAHDAD